MGEAQECPISFEELGDLEKEFEDAENEIRKFPSGIRNCAINSTRSY
jgi:hypothetical protein